MRLNYKGILRFAILLAMNIVIWNFFRSYINFIIGVLMVMAAVISVVMTCRLAGRLEVRLLFPSGFVAPGFEFEFGVEVKSPVHFWMFFTRICYKLGNVFVEKPHRRMVNMPVYWGSEALEKSRITSHYCGIIEGEIEKFEVGDLFNLIWINVSCNEKGHVVVYPNGGPEKEDGLSDMVAGFSLEDENNQKGMDFNPDYEIREYVPGDDLKAIHWKLTAKQEKFMVRERLSSGHNKINVLLELTRDIQMNEELIHSLNSVCRNFLLSEFPVELYWWNYFEKKMQCRLLLEEGELQGVICEILGMNALEEDAHTRHSYEMTKGNEPYVMITAGESKGEYIRMVS